MLLLSIVDSPPVCGWSFLPSRTLLLYLNVYSLLDDGKLKASGAGAPWFDYILPYNYPSYSQLRHGRFAIMGAVSHHEISRLG